MKALSQNKDLLLSLNYYLLFIYLGLSMGAAGPTIPSLATQLGVSIGSMGLLLVIGSIGYTLGTSLSGRIFDRLPAHPVLGVSLLVCAALTALIPLIPLFWLLAALYFVRGIFDSMAGAGPNTLLVWVHKAKAAPYINALHFFFGLGAFLSPFIFGLLVGFENGYRWIFWILSAYAALAGIRLLTLPGSPQPEAAKTATTQTPGLKIPYPLVFAAAFFLFFYVSAELSFGNWIYTYTLSLNLTNAAGAAFLNSGFWFAFTFGRLVSVPLAVRFKPAQMVAFGLGGALFFALIPFLFPHSLSALWVVALGLGLFMAPVWPGGFNLAGQSLVLTATISSIILLGDSLGGMILPSATGKIIEGLGAPAMIYLVFASLALNLVAFLFMLKLRQKESKIPGV
ncbi:MAG: MFS transporter [Anaerolineales bacterium]|jgi:FHS family Na+ dependent glucose MFS transporter 1|nr:MFS transporter [Anaerolineales bacterium]